MSRFRVIPVIDLMGGLVVHGIQGKRDQYLPVKSVIAESSDPIEIILGFQDRLGLKDLYVADLDALTGKDIQRQLLGTIHSAVAGEMWIDGGISDLKGAKTVFGDDPQEVVVIGTETVATLEDLTDIADFFDPEKTVLSLDLFQGKLRAPEAFLKEIESPLDVVECWGEAGQARMIVLDLQAVGSQAGSPIGMLRKVIQVSEGWGEVYGGGGVTTVDDLLRVRKVGAVGCLVATALHRGTINREHLEALTLD